MLKVIVALLIVYNFCVYCLYGYDKKRAKEGKWRVPEKTLLLCAACAGGIGAFLGMKLFRHKTKHIKFVILVPLFLVIQLGLAAFLLTRFVI